MMICLPRQQRFQSQGSMHASLHGVIMCNRPGSHSLKLQCQKGLTTFKTSIYNTEGVACSAPDRQLQTVGPPTWKAGEVLIAQPTGSASPQSTGPAAGSCRCAARSRHGRGEVTVTEQIEVFAQPRRGPSALPGMLADQRPACSTSRERQIGQRLPQHGAFSAAVKVANMSAMDSCGQCSRA